MTDLHTQAREMLDLIIHDLPPDSERLYNLITALSTALAAAEAALATARTALINVAELNLTAEDENGHRWDNSDLIAQEIHAALSAITKDTK